MRVLLLGGTAEARELAALLEDDGDEVLTSLAGRVARPRLPVGEVRIGGFGGVAGLREAAVGFDVVIDATHPFAAGISANAVAACDDVPLLRLQRPGWSDVEAVWVDTHVEAAAAAAAYARPFLTIGRQQLQAFRDALADHPALVRVVDETEVPPAWTLLRDRGPYDPDCERELLLEHRIDVVVTKDSGGSYTRPKLDAAGELGVPVIVVRRPPVPAGVTCVEDAAAARRWVRARSVLPERSAAPTAGRG